MKNQLIFLAKTKKIHEELSKAPWSGNEEHRKPDTVPLIDKNPRTVLLYYTHLPLYTETILNFDGGVVDPYAWPMHFSETSAFRLF